MSETKTAEPASAPPTPAEIEMQKLSERHRALRERRAAIDQELALLDEAYTKACALVAIEKKRAKFELSLTPAERAALSASN